MTSMTSSVKGNDLDFKISVAVLARGNEMRRDLIFHDSEL